MPGLDVVGARVGRPMSPVREHSPVRGRGVPSVNQRDPLFQVVSLCFLMVICMCQGLNSHYFHTSSTAQGGGGSFKKRKTIGEIGCCESRMSKQKH